MCVLVPGNEGGALASYSPCVCPTVAGQTVFEIRYVLMFVFVLSFSFSFAHEILRLVTFEASSKGRAPKLLTHHKSALLPVAVSWPASKIAASCAYELLWPSDPVGWIAGSASR